MKWTQKLTVLLIVLFSCAAQAGQPKVEYYAVSPDMQLPFSEAIRVGPSRLSRSTSS